MKRALGSLAVNWLRKPENQERIKRTARDVWGHFQERRNARASGQPQADNAPAASRPSADPARRDRDDEQA